MPLRRKKSPLRPSATTASAIGQILLPDRVSDRKSYSVLTKILRSASFTFGWLSWSEVAFAAVPEKDVDDGRTYVGHPVLW